MRYLILLAAIFAVAGFGQDPPARGAAPAFKNLQVLQPGDIRTAMAAASTGLGVQCTECHVADRSSDEKRDKLIARRMFSMTAQINAGFPDGKAHVSCYTCHRGQKEPLMAPPAAAPAQ